MTLFTTNPLEKLMIQRPIPAKPGEMERKLRLILCEKPSVAGTIAAVLGFNKRYDGYLEGKEYVISWCFGHLAELAQPDVYDEKYTKWRYTDFPIVPETWQYSISREKSRQFEIVCDLMKREDIGEIVNACDAGREGELIFRTVYNLAECGKPIKRLWISSMEDSAIRDGFANLKEGSDYDNLYKSAMCRAKADWLVGINATRLFSVLYHRTSNVGRVVSPTLALIVQREAEIKSFKPESFFTINLDFDGFTAVSERFADENEAKNVLENCKEASVTSITRREKSENPPALYDLTTLQRDANRMYGFTAQQTLDYTQSLYEKKLCTYPRTDSRYLTDNMDEKAKSLIPVAAEIAGIENYGTFYTAQVLNSGKVSDHHAIIPTSNVKTYDIDSLTDGEKSIIYLISRQFLMALSEPHRYAETEIIIESGGHEFRAKGKEILCCGWRMYLNESADKLLPNLIEGKADFERIYIKEGKTTPPKDFTEDTLLSAMENVVKCDSAERRGIGTPATRAGIIEKLVSGGFIERKNNRLIPTHTGDSLITVLPEQLQSPLITSEWETRLAQIERGELSADDFMSEITEMVDELVKDYRTISGAEVLFPSGRTVVGKCPRCGGDVTESKNGYFCEKNECRFGIWRDNMFLTSKKIKLNSKMVNNLLAEGRTFISGIYSEKTGKSYDAYIRMSDDGEKIKYSIEFEGKNK